MKLTLLLLIFALILESSATTIPLILLVLLCSAVIFRQNWIFVLGFIFGLLFDLMVLRNAGLSSAFFVLFLFLVLLYQSKFEIATNAFIFFASLLGSFFYLVLIGYHDGLILEAIVSSLIGLLLFRLLKRVKVQVKN